MANRFKDHNHNAYDWVPEMFGSLNPAPRYMNRPLGESQSYPTWKARRAREAIGKVKNPLINVQAK